MALVKIPKKELARQFRINERLITMINQMGIPVEQMTADAFEVEVLPNRADALSAQGFLRALCAFAGKEQGIKNYPVKSPEKNFTVEIDSSVKDVRPYTACAIIKNLKLNDEKIREIIELQEKLHTTLGRNRKKAAIGVYPLEKIALPIRFEARKPNDIRFIPLESSEEMSGLEILQRHPTGRAYAPLLSGLAKFPIFVDAHKKILSMPPIINSHETGKITAATKEVFIECSGFDFPVLKKILNILVTALADMGGKIYAMELKYGKKEREITPNLVPDKVKLSLENTNKLLGLDLKEKDLEKLLPKMGYAYSKGAVSVPAWRADILHEVDIIEDIAIAYGYDRFIPEIPKVATIGEESQESKLRSKLTELLIGLGMLEVSSYHLIKEEEAVRARQTLVKLELENSKSEYKLLRPNLLIPALRIFSENKDHEYPQRIFEIGSVFLKDARRQLETGIYETTHLLFAASPANVTEIQKILDSCMRMLSLPYSIKETIHPLLIDGRIASIVVNGKVIGFFGEVHPAALRDWNIRMPIAICELTLDALLPLVFVKKA